MSKLEIENTGLVKFFKMCQLVNCGPETEVKEILVNCKANEINTLTHAPNKAICYCGAIKGNFADFGEVGIDNLPPLSKFIESVLGKFSLKKTENKLICEIGKTKLTNVLRSPKYMTSITPEAKFKELTERADGNRFTLKSADIQSILSYNRTVKASFIQFAGQGKTIKVTLLEGETELEQEFDITNEVQEFNVKIGNLFVGLLEVLKEFDINFSMKTKCPIHLKVEDKEVNFQYIIAPLDK